MCGLLFWFSTAAYAFPFAVSEICQGSVKDCVVYCSGLVLRLMHFLSQLVRSAKARLKTLDTEADHETLVWAHTTSLSSSDVIPSSSQEVR